MKYNYNAQTGAKKLLIQFSKSYVLCIMLLTSVIVTLYEWRYTMVLYKTTYVRLLKTVFIIQLSVIIIIQILNIISCLLLDEWCGSSANNSAFNI